MFYGGIVPIGASAQRRQQALFEQEEEEEMAQYTRQDLDDDWEFKIVRASTPVFRKPKELNRLIEEEAQAGWVMLEKLDDYRVRFKRPRHLRAQDAYLPSGIDPYRTQYGAAPAQHITMALVAAGLLVLLGLGIAALLLASHL